MASQADAQEKPLPETQAAQSPAQAREAYAKAKQDLIDALTKKRALDKQLVACEVQIYHAEASYLTDTAGSGGGNIIQGFDGYLKNPGMHKRRPDISDSDRMFSNSSSTYAKSLELQAEESDTASEPVSKYSTPGLQTVMLHPATRQQELQSAAVQKKERDKLYQRQKRARKGSKGATSGDENEYSAGNNNKKKKTKFIDDE